MVEFQEIRQLFDTYDDSFGFSEEEIINCEKDLGQRLPEVLRQYYLQLGNNEQINQTQDSLVLPKDLKLDAANFVTFYYENQSVWKAGIKLSDFSLEDPPVYILFENPDWKLENEKLSDFLTAIAFLQSLFALDFTANCIDIGKDKENFIHQNWKKLKIKTSLWGIFFFQNSPDEVIALMINGNQTDLFISAKTEEQFVEINNQFNIDWDYNSLEDE